MKMIVRKEIQNLDATSLEIKTLLAKLANVRQFSTGRSSDLIEVVLSPEDFGGGASLPKMWQLEISRVEPELGSAQDTIANLALYPSLTSLDLYSTSYRPLSIVSLPSIRRLTLRRAGPAQSEEARRICRRFPSIRDLTLVTTSTSAAGFKPHLQQCAAHPSLKLKSLTLSTRPGVVRPDYSHYCDHFLLPFHRLSYLYLGPNTFSQEIGNSLIRLPRLETLGFGLGAILEEKRLEALVFGPSRIPTLKKLVLDHIKGAMGWSARREGNSRELHADHLSHKHHLGPGWKVPEFNPLGNGTLTAGGLENSVRRIEEAGIEVEGKVLNAFEVEREYREEVTCCEGLWQAVMEASEKKEMEELLALNDYYEPAWVLEQFI